MEQLIIFFFIGEDCILLMTLLLFVVKLCIYFIVLLPFLTGVSMGFDELFFVLFLIFSKMNLELIFNI